MTFTWIPEFGVEGDVTPNVTIVKFGDGYQQRQPAGMNTMTESWPLTFANREPDESAAILAFLVARGGAESFDWTTPEGIDIQVICSKWSKIPQKGGRFSITATFDQVFEP